MKQRYRKRKGGMPVIHEDTYLDDDAFEIVSRCQRGGSQLILRLAEGPRAHLLTCHHKDGIVILDEHSSIQEIEDDPTKGTTMKVKVLHRLLVEVGKGVKG